MALAAGLAIGGSLLSGAISAGTMFGVSAMNNSANQSLNDSSLKQQYDYNSKLANQYLENDIKFSSWKQAQLEKAGLPAAAMYTRGDPARYYVGNGTYFIGRNIGSNTQMPSSPGAANYNMYNPFKYANDIKVASKFIGREPPPPPPAVPLDLDWGRSLTRSSITRSL